MVPLTYFHLWNMAKPTYHKSLGERIIGDCLVVK